MSRKLFYIALSTSILVTSPVFSKKATAVPDTETVPTEPTAGPKVHVSDAKDTSGCKNLEVGAAKGAGRLAGAIFGAKLGKGAKGVLGGAAAGEAVANKVEKNKRCGTKAEIENGSDSND